MPPIYSSPLCNVVVGHVWRFANQRSGCASKHVNHNLIRKAQRDCLRFLSLCGKVRDVMKVPHAVGTKYHKIGLCLPRKSLAGASASELYGFSAQKYDIFTSS